MPRETDYSDLSNDDEIDLGQLFATLWAHKFFIAFVSVITLSLANIYVSYIAKPMYEATSSFALYEKSNIPNLGELGALASLAGFSTGGESSKVATLRDRVMSRRFILELSDRLDLMRDPFFNATLREPRAIGRTRLKMLLGITTKNEPLSIDKLTASLIGTFRKNVTLTITKSGLIEISIQHINSERAADLANDIVEKILTDLLIDQRADDREQIDYLASELYVAQEKLEAAAEAMQSYAIENNLTSTEDFKRASVQLSGLRETTKKLTEYATLIDFLQNAKSWVAVWEPTSGEALLEKYPYAEDQEFRSFMGWPAQSAKWKLPPLSGLENASQQIAHRLVRVQRSMTKLETQAKIDADAAVELARLKRTIKVQDTVYEVLVRQFETQNLSSGFQSDVGDLYEVAVPPLRPVSPKKSLILALGLVLGLFLGMGAALLMAIRTGVLYTKTSITNTLGIPLGHHKNFAGLKRKLSDTEKLALSVLRDANPDLDDLIITMAGDKLKVIGIYALNQTIAVRGAALYIGQKMAKFNNATVVLDLAGAISIKNLNIAEDVAAEFSGWHLQNGLIVLRLAAGTDAVFSQDFERSLSQLKAQYDCLIIVFPTLPTGLAASLSSRKIVEKILILATPRACLRENAERMKSILNRMLAKKPMLICD